MFSQLSSLPTGKTSMAVSDTQRQSRLLRQVAENGSKEAFEQLFSFYAPRIKALMLKYDRDNELAEDLTQETMLSVWRKAKLYSPSKGSPSTWIFTIARNNRIDRFRKQGAGHYVDIDDVEIIDATTPDGETNVMNDQRDSIVAAIRSELPSDQLEVITLSFEHNLAQTEIAEKLCIPLGTVKSRMRLAYNKMKIKLEDVI